MLSKHLNNKFITWRDTLQIINYVPNASFVESKRELCEECEITFFTIAASGLPYTDSGFYSIWQIVLTYFGCMDSTMRTIFVKKLSAFVPSAFTPNNDGNNDIYSPVISGNDPSVYSLVIFTRWGDVVFEISDMSAGWYGSHQGIPSEVGV